MCLYTVVIPAPAAALSLASQIEELRACVASASAPESSSACSCGSSRAPFTLRWPRLPIAMVRGARRGAGREADGRLRCYQDVDPQARGGWGRERQSICVKIADRKLFAYLP